ncbi:hypothetical protein F3Y22_tig00110450pilonHSYRG00503 [Hibiscus syriacus]|uniref:Uncharacterized protein n=1 Tax=Hibiscus syriacus TaxID=106335 RepID=A0A6A3AM85_HIBSY|nr:hypothetical protein F3Y22_tig00110450pilonHSYRG00503 [Hibiscus syriacus]
MFKKVAFLGLCRGVDVGFSVVAGLKLNKNKTKLFGITLEGGVVRRWADQIHCGWAELLSTYLGLPLEHRKNSKSLWQPILDKIKSRLQSWKGKMLSMGGRQVLDRAVSVVQGPDRVIWAGAQDGMYNTKAFCLKVAAAEGACLDRCLATSNGSRCF